MAKQQPLVFQILIRLDDISPQIWRRILVNGNTTLLKLHDIIQIVMGWENYHLHSFSIDGEIFGNPEDDEFGDMGTINDAEYKLEDVLTRKNQTFQYQYDFGDGWEHTLFVEKTFPPEKGNRYPRCLDGQRACPPENVGGAWGYHEFIEFNQNPNANIEDKFIFWPTEKFDPEAFDLASINQQLQNMGRGISTESKSFWYMTEYFPQKAEIDRFSHDWVKNLSKTHRSVAELLPLRRDMVSMLVYLRDHKVRGTTSTGNFPLKNVTEICETFVAPPPLEHIFGTHSYPVRSETEVWPLYFLHTLASVGRLVIGGQGRQWQLTEGGNEFLEATPSAQIFFLTAIWWTQTNWAVHGYNDFTNVVIDSGIETLALTQIKNLSDTMMIPIETFYDRMIKDVKRILKFNETDRIQDNLQYLIRRVVIEPNIDLGILEVESKPDELLGKDFPQPSKIKATSFGKELIKQLPELFNKLGMW